MNTLKGYKRKYEQTLEKIRELSLSYYGNSLISLVVFGSVAKGVFNPFSDIDLLIILKKRGNFYKEYSEYFDNIEAKLNSPYKSVEINPIFKAATELTTSIPYLWNTDFVVLFDRDNFFKKYLVSLNKFKRDSLIIHNKPIEYIELKNGK